MNRTWRIAGINFDHFHMGDLLRMAHEHPQVEIVGLSDEQPERMRAAQRSFGVSLDHLYTDYRACIERTKPDLVILCPASAQHGLWTKRIAEYGVHILIEKPFAASLAEADEMIAAQAKAGKLLAINWPIRWFPAYITAKRLIDDGVIGTVTNVHHYGGNRGPLHHGADKIERQPTAEEKAASWFYQRKTGGGSMLDYLGYGTTMAAWFFGGKKPLEVAAVTDEQEGLEVDEHSVTVARYDVGLSKFETRWGTFTDPWTEQPQPKCGFVICGTEGTISAYDYADRVRVQTRAFPERRKLKADQAEPPFENPIQYMVHLLEGGEMIEDPLHPKIARIGQQIVDSAVLSAREKRTVRLIE
jgi:glucose-fructose oxidoreductase